MTISRRLGIGYASIAAVCLALVAWLGYHEFVEEPAEYAAKGLTNLHRDTQAELSTVCFLALVPVLLGAGWLWVRHALSPLKSLSEAVERVDSLNLGKPLPRSRRGDEVDRLAAAFNVMTARLDEGIRHIHEFTLHASHELKTPLTVMRAQLETVLREAPFPVPDHLQWVEGQIDEVNRLTRIVDSLSLLTKADAGLVTLEQRPVNLRELVVESYEDAQVLASPRGLTVTLGPCEDVTVIGDRHRLRQLFLILADNAVKYSTTGATITMSLGVHNGAAGYQISNPADDISDSTLSRIFGRFVRGENARGTADGCGLGLTIAKWIVDSHGGSIRLGRDDAGRIAAQIRIPLPHAATAGPESPGAAGPAPASR
ncbi:MAG: HAMP domain-containing protein [Verrucomicrobiales bacterium]|nr:HAMP domain-containing protein [Verrucomicrobiales bacterium]